MNQTTLAEKIDAAFLSMERPVLALVFGAHYLVCGADWITFDTLDEALEVCDPFHECSAQLSTVARMVEAYQGHDDNW